MPRQTITRSRVAVALLSVAGVALLVALIGAGSLPAQGCDPLQQTERLQKLVIATLAVAFIGCLMAMAVSMEGTVARKTRFLFLSFGLLELAAVAAIITYYNNQTAAYGLCG